KMGWDMFDCVIPTREARHGRLYVFAPRGRPARANASARTPRRAVWGSSFYKVINIKNSKFSKDFSPINPISKIPELRNYSKAYLNYLFKINENLAQYLATLNNLEFYLDLFKQIRLNIKEGKF
ncbi:MAG: tRNA-guanine transglycosylase, partial [Candidatus Falkowbacteria bacterium]